MSSRSIVFLSRKWCWSLFWMMMLILSSLALALALPLMAFTTQPFYRSTTTTTTTTLLTAAQVSSIESTPNPSSFLLQLSEPLSGLEDLVGSLQGRTYSKTTTTTLTLPTEIATMLDLDGIDSVYAMATALTINKTPAAKWNVVLPLVLKAIDGGGGGGGDAGQENHKTLLQGLLSSSTTTTNDDATATAATSGQVRIRLQISNNMPIQIEGIGFLGTTSRKKLAPKFAENMEVLVDGGADFFANRQWVDRGMRYIDNNNNNNDDDDESVDNNNNNNSKEAQEKFELMTVLQAEYEEYDAAYSEERLATIVAKQLGDSSGGASAPPPPPASGTIPFSEMDLERVQQQCDLAEHGNLEALTVLSNFVKSQEGNMAARRNALAFLGATGSTFPGIELVFDTVVLAMQREPNPIMRRTAGDALSDLGDPCAVPCAIEALNDRSKLVQWRAARIAGELGTTMETAAALKEASFSSKYAFEVAFEIKDAMRKVRERALNDKDGTGSGPGAGPIWKQIQDGMAEKKRKSE